MTTETPAGRRSSAPLAPPGDRPDRGITDSQLAVLLRQTQWALDEAAHDFPAGRGSAQRRAELAETLEALAAIVRASAPEHTTTQAPADRRLSAPAPLPAPGDRPGTNPG